MLFLENLKPLKIYKRPMYLPTIEGDKKKNSLILLLTPNYESSKGIMTSDMLINKLRFASYYIEKDTTFFIGKKAMKEVEDITETYVHNMTQFDLYQSLCEMTAAERNSLKDSDFGLPDKRKYPLDTIDHVKSAIKFFNYVDKEEEKELAKNINKAIKKYNMTVNVGSKNRFSKYYNESVVYENNIINGKDIYYNKDKFDSGEINLCFITGHSGSGKSTMGRDMSKDNTEHYELDDLNQNYNFSDANLKEYGDLIYSFFKTVGKKYRYYSYEDMQNCTNPLDDSGDKYDECINKDFIHYAILYAKSHKNKKFVIEGIWLYFFIKPEELKDYAVYIKGTSRLISIYRASKRDSSDENNKLKRVISIGKNIFNHIFDKYSLDAEKLINKWRKYFTQLQGTNLSETVNIPDRCPECNGKVVCQIKGEPVYVCSNCGKYFGTVPFPDSMYESAKSDPYKNPILEKEWGFTHVDGLYHALVKVEGIDKNLRGRSEMLVLDPTMTKIYLVFDKNGKDYKVPGGGFDYNETHKESAIRETREEARIEAVGVYDSGVRYVKMYDDDPAVRQKEFAEENRFYGAYTEIFIGTYANNTFDELLNTLDVDDSMTKGKFYNIEDVYDKLTSEHKRALNFTIKESYITEKCIGINNSGGYKYFHLAKSGDIKILNPIVPDNYFTKNNYEDGKTKRVCFAPSIDQCLMALSVKFRDDEYFVYVMDGDYDVYKTSVSDVPDSKITGEVWIKEPVKVKCIGKIKVINDAMKAGKPFKYGNKTAELYEWNYKWIESYITENCETNLSNLTRYHLELVRKGFNPKISTGGWDEELYSKDLNSAIINDICGKYEIKDIIANRGKTEAHVFTCDNELSAIYLGKITIRFFDISPNTNPDRICKFRNVSFDWEWDEQEDISQELINYFKEEVWKESVSNESTTASFSVSANIVKDGKVLLEYHKKCNAYSLPGGKQNENETPMETLNRELKEELGITPINVALCNKNTFDCEYPKGSGIIRTFTDYNFDVLDYSGEIQNLESDKHSELIWMNFESMEYIAKSELLNRVRNHYMRKTCVVNQTNEFINNNEKFENLITCSGYSKDITWLKDIATPELYNELIDALGLSIEDYNKLPIINFIGSNSEYIEIDTNNNVIDIYCFSPTYADNVTRDNYVKYAIEASLIVLIVIKFPNLDNTVIPMCIAEAILGNTDGFSKFALRMIQKYTLKGFYEKLNNLTNTEFFKNCKSSDLDKVDSLDQFVLESSEGVATASRLTKNLKYKNATKNKIKIGRLRNKVSRLSNSIKDSIRVDAPKVTYSGDNEISAESVIQSLNEGSYIINGDYISIFTEDASNDPYLRKIFYTERIKKRSDILELLDRAKNDIPAIKYAYPDLDRYAGRNLFVDLYYFNECFFKNNTLNVIRSYKLYLDLIDRLINDKRFSNYKRKTVFIPVNDWHKNPSTRMWYYKEDLNPISMIYEMMYRSPELLKKVFKNTSIVFIDKNKYFTINTNSITKQDVNKFKMFITKINKNEEFDSSDVDSDEKQSPESIKTDIMDKIEISKGVDLTKAKVDVDKEKKSRSNIVVSIQPESPADKKNSDSKEEKSEKLKDVARTIDDTVDNLNPTDTEDALDNLDNDENFKELLIGLDSMRDDTVNISAARAERMSELDRQLLDKTIKNRSIRDILDENKDSTKELPKTELNIATPNEEWKNLQYINYDKTYDVDADLVKVFHSLSKMSHPMSIVDIKSEDNSTSEDALFLYTVLYEDFRGKRYTIKLDIPKIVKNRFMLRGNAKTIQTQFFNMPILKTDLDTAQVVTNYKKIIVSRYNTSSGKSLPNTARLIKALDKYTGRKIKISTGDNSRVCNKYDLVIDYIDLASVYSKIETEDYIFYFDQDELNNTYNNVSYEKGFPFAYDKTKKTLIYYLNNDTVPFINRLTDLLFIDNKHNDLLELFNNAKAPSRLMYSRARIMGSDIPLIIVCAYSEGLSKVLNKANISYRLTDKLTSEEKHDPNNNFIKFSDGYLLYKVDYTSSLLLNGLNDVDTLSHSITEIDDRNMYLEFLDGYGGRIKADGLDNFYDCEIDPITEETLKFYKLPTDYISVLLYTNYLLADNKFFRHTDTSSRRARRFELIAAYTYQVITEAYGTYANSIKHNRNQVPFSCKQSAVVDKILLDPTSSDYSVINALNDVETTNAISTKGLSGMNSERSYSLDKRTYDKSMINVVGMSTGFSGNVGITRQATINMAIEGKRGYVKDNKGKTDNMNAANTLTATEAMVPLSTTHDDTMRVAMTFIQTCKHAVRTQESDPLLVTNGADEALPYLCSDQFAHKSKGKGFVKELTDEYMIVEYDDGNKEYINLSQTIEKNSDGGFYVTLKLDADPKLKEGSKIKPNQILAWDKQSMSNSLGESDNLAYNTGKLAKIAIINTEEGFEDSGICTEEIAEKLACKITNKSDCVLDKNTNVFNVAKVGTKVEQGDTLMVWQTPYDEEEVNILLKTLAGDKEAVSELGRHTIKSEYTGTVVGIKIYRTVKDDELSESLKKLVKQYERPITELRKKLKEEDIDVSGLPANYPLEPTGKLKGAADGVLIEFYVEYYDKLGIGDKITYNAANKAVIKNIIPKGKEPYTDFRPNEPISAFVSVTSIDKRMVTSTISYGALQKLMIELDRSCKDIAGIPYDDSKV